MRFMIMLLLLGATLWFGTQSLLETKPKWFLSAVVAMPFINSDVVLTFDGTLRTWTEEDVREKYASLIFDCQPEASNLGDRHCYAYIREFNSVKANNIAFFFDKNRFNSLRVGFPLNQHQNLLNYLNSVSSQRRTVADSVAKNGQEVGMWMVEGGALATFEERPKTDEESILNWNSMNKLTYYK